MSSREQRRPPLQSSCAILLIVPEECSRVDLSLLLVHSQTEYDHPHPVRQAGFANRGNVMKAYRIWHRLFAVLAVGTLCSLNAFAQETAKVHMVVTAESTNEEVSPADFDRRSVLVKQGKDRLQVSDWIPARGDQSALQLFILIDDTCASSMGSYLDDLRTFIKAQPATTSVAVGYMRNANVTVVKDFTTDHEQAASALRLPLGSLSSQDSPYLSLISLVKRWPESKVRREVLMITDGIDRLRGYVAATPANMGRTSPSRQVGPTMPYISPDVGTASEVSQHYGIIVHSIYARGVGRADRNYYESQNGLNGLSKLSDETGGEAFLSDRAEHREH